MKMNIEPSSTGTVWLFLACEAPEMVAFAASNQICSVGAFGRRSGSIPNSILSYFCCSLRWFIWHCVQVWAFWFASTAASSKKQIRSSILFYRWPSCLAVWSIYHISSHNEWCLWIPLRRSNLSFLFEVEGQSSTLEKVRLQHSFSLETQHLICFRVSLLLLMWVFKKTQSSHVKTIHSLVTRSCKRRSLVRYRPARNIWVTKPTFFRDRCLASNAALQ